MYILLVENDDLDKTDTLLSSLEDQGYHVCVVRTPEIAVEKAETLWPSVLVFNPGDIRPNLVNIQQAISQIELDIPSIVVTSKDRQEAKLSDGPILVTPHDPQQLSQSIEQATAEQKDRFLRLPNLVVDCEHHKVLRNKKPYSLTPKEFKLLHLLIINRDQIMSRKIIMQKVWETDYLGDTRTLDVHIRWIREKIEENPSQPHRIITVRGVGYRFIEDTEAE